ncbi:MAG: ATP-binding protein [Ginsengibacter sp.]
MKQEKTISELVSALKDLTFRNEENQKRISTLVALNDELDFQNKKKESEEERIKEGAERLAETLRIKTLEEKNGILESIGDAFFAVDKDWVVTFWNNQAEKMLEKKKDEIIGKNLWSEFPQSVESLSFKKYHQAIETNTILHFEDYYQTINRWYEISAYPLEGGLSVYFKDVSERKLSDIRVNQLNESLQKQTDKLTVSNEELERFAYVTSHDLQEPLRMVSSFLQLLQKKYDNQLDETARKYINFAVDGAERMKILILDLLEFSRISAFVEDHITINLNDVIAKALLDLKVSIDESAAIIEVASLPQVCGNRSQLLQLFENIIGNAIKYKGHSTPVISIGYIDLPGEWQFYVQDNGIGIDEKFYEKVFIIFQRLHSRKEYKGTGIGLAICKKIVELHGGRIWLESIRNHGSKFFFTIRKLQVSNHDDSHVLCEDIDECIK